eukprot:4956026-Ditylum_brightwellii.AAC.1
MALIQKIIDTIGFQNASGKTNPAEVAEFPAYVDGLGPQEHWSYASILLWPYISAHNTHIIRVTVMKRLSKELCTTLLPQEMQDQKKKGLWGCKDSQDPSSVKSRARFVLTLGTMPILWVSKLQTEIACSTMEAEYIALAHST